MKNIVRYFVLSNLLWLTALGHAQTMAPTEAVAAKVMPSVVLILTGEGAGRLNKIGTGVIVQENGVLLTAYHLIKEAKEVQVRLKNGEVFDQVELLAVDERRDVAALRISAKSLPVLTPAEAEVGARVYSVANPAGLTWSMADGLLSGIRLSDEASSLDKGYKLLQFSAPASVGSSGGALVDAQGRLLGIIVSSKNGQNLNFAIPINSILGLTEVAQGLPLGTGQALRLPQPPQPALSATLTGTDIKEQLRHVRSIYIYSHTSFLNAEQLMNELQKREEFTAWKILLVKDAKLADAELAIDRPLFTFIYTFSLTDKKTSVVLASGKLTAWDGNMAAPSLAKEIIKRFKIAHQLPDKNNAKKATP